MPSQKLLATMRDKHSIVRPICDAYAEGVLDGIKAEQLRQVKRNRPYDPGSRMHRQVGPRGETLESLLEVRPNRA